MFGLGIAEITVILLVALLVLGPKRLPDAARSLGRSLAEFRRASTDIRNALILESSPEPGPPPSRPHTPAASSETPPSAQAPGGNDTAGAASSRPSQAPSVGEPKEGAARDPGSPGSDRPRE